MQGETCGLTPCSKAEYLLLLTGLKNRGDGKQAYGNGKIESHEKLNRKSEEANRKWGASVARCSNQKNIEISGLRRISTLLLTDRPVNKHTIAYFLDL